MIKISIRTSVMLLTFSLGVAATATLFFQTSANKNDFQVNNENNIVIEDNKKTSVSDKTLEMVFVLDTTGSMGGLIDGAKQRIWGIVNEVMQKQSRPNVRVGLVAYRDKGDTYVTQVLPLTDDLDKVYSTLMDYRADGGGDTPENVRRALAEGVSKAGWSNSKKNVARILFLVGDAPPQNYQDEPDVLTTTAEAVKKDMIINTIQCGEAGDTRQIWQQIALRGEGKYFAIAQDGGVQAISTPFDSRLAELGNKIGQTYIAYGGGAGDKAEALRQEKINAQAALEMRISSNATMGAQADRALNKAVNRNAYVGDLLQDLENGIIKIENVKVEDLPEDLRKLPEVERRKEIERRLAERKKIREEIVMLSKKRDEFIAAERKKNLKQSGFDAAVAEALREQLARKGIK
jgi:Mg-chelatase subunit ChlD